VRQSTMLALVAIVVLTRCATVQPYKVSTRVSGLTTDEVYRCALAQATGLGYTAEQADRESGFFKAEKNFVPGPASINWGVPITFALTVLVAEDTAGHPSLQITGATGKGASRNMRLVETSEEVRGHADQIIKACGARVTP
jgi:hypothetical protein